MRRQPTETPEAAIESGFSATTWASVMFFKTLLGHAVSAHLDVLVRLPWDRDSDWLQEGGSGDGTPVGTNFSAPLQTSPRA